MTEINVYCDESCHLPNDGKNAMVLGAVWCPRERIYAINREIRSLKLAHGLTANYEYKWTKVSSGRQEFYLALVNYFFDTVDLNFRGYVANKANLNHSALRQTHDEWYYKIYFRMLEHVLDPRNSYDIYLDIKDTRGGARVRKLNDVLCNAQRDFDRSIVRRIQIIESHDAELMQLADILIGALSFLHQGEAVKPTRNTAKMAVISKVKERSGLSLMNRTTTGARKFNLFFWHPAGMEDRG